MLNWLGILAAVVWAQLLGMVWYGKIGFMKPWMKLVSLKKMKPNSGAMVLGLIQSIVTAVVLSVFVDFLADSFFDGMMIGFVMWAGFVATTQLSPILWEEKPFNLWIINTGYSLVSYVVMGGLLSVI